MTVKFKGEKYLTDESEEVVVAVVPVLAAAAAAAVVVAAVAEAPEFLSCAGLLIVLNKLLKTPGPVPKLPNNCIN